MGIERDDALLADLKERATQYHISKGITENDYDEFMKDVDMEAMDDMDLEFLLDRYPMAMDSQLIKYSPSDTTSTSQTQTQFVPNFYLSKVELYQMYLEQNENESDDDADNELSDAEIENQSQTENQNKSENQTETEPIAKSENQIETENISKSEDKSETPKEIETKSEVKTMTKSTPKSENETIGKKEEYFKINKRPKDDSSDEEQAKLKKAKKSKQKSTKSPKSPKTPKVAKAYTKTRKITEIALNDDYDAKEREEMIERRRDRRRAQRKADKEIEAQIDFEINNEQTNATQNKKMSTKKFRIGDNVRVIKLNGKKVKYPGVIRWVGMLDEDIESNKFIKENANKIKKTFG